MCRRCINEKYGLSLVPENCFYLHFQSICANCGELHNIVLDVDRPTRWQIRRKVKTKK